jgi:hypothetical protein
MSPYAQDTNVSIARSKQEIESMLKLRGASQFASGWDETGGERIQFCLNKVTIRFTLPPMAPESYGISKAGRQRNAEKSAKAKGQLERSRWRQLYLVIKAKLEAVDAGISIYEEEFRAFVVMANGQTIGSVLTSRIQGGGRLALGDGKDSG